MHEGEGKGRERIERALPQLRKASTGAKREMLDALAALFMSLVSLGLGVAAATGRA